MDLTPEVKAEIDAKSYYDLLQRWRFSPCGDEMFQGESGKYWQLRMKELRSLPGGDEEHVRCSKAIGW